MVFTGRHKYRLTSRGSDKIDGRRGLLTVKRIAALLLSALIAHYARGEVVSSVCQLLANPAEHSGEVVTLRGVLLHDTSIADPGCREMPTFHDESWEPGVWIKIGPDAYPPDSASLFAKSKQAAATHKVVRATFEGVLRYCPVQSQTSLPGGREIWNGCATGNYFPLELDVRTVRNVTIEADPFAGEAPALPPEDPPPGLWVYIRAELTAAGGDRYFLTWCKGAQFPYLTGRLISAYSGAQSAILILAMADGEAPAVTLQLDGALPGWAQPGAVVAFSGVAKSYRPDPFMLTFSVDPASIRVRSAE
jgi:hypothetical protein